MSACLPYTPTEVQQLAFYFRSMTKLREFLNLDGRSFKKYCEQNEILDPCRYVRSLRTPVLEQELIFHRSIQALADSFGVSSSFMETVLTERGIDKSESDPLSSWHPDQFIGHLSRIKNVSIMAHLFQTKESTIRKYAADHNIELCKYIKIGHSNSTSEIGRKAELAWAELRGDKILKDMNGEEGSQHPYDFEDKDLGQVDVKSSPYRPYTSKSRQGHGYWNFRLANLTPSVTIVLAFMDKTGNKLLDWAVLKNVPEASGVLVRSDKLDLRVLQEVGKEPYPVLWSGESDNGADIE